MCRASKWSIAVLCTVIISIYFLTSLPGCKDPEEFAPDDDTLIPPPGPPELLGPTDGYVFNVVSDPMSYSYDVTLEWTAVEGNELYEVEFTTDTFPPVILSSPTSSVMITFRDLHRLCEHHWRVRASSTHWLNFTEWSGQRTFELRQQPNGPMLISPANDTVFYIDSLPLSVEFAWDTVQDEEYYWLYLNEDLYRLYTNEMTEVLDDTGLYTWRVQAGSDMWALPSLWSSTWQFSVQYNP